MMGPLASYQETIERHNLTALAEGADIQNDASGDLALTKDGDFRFGSTAYDAMFRLVEAWRLNAPSMRLMFDAVVDLQNKEQELGTATELSLIEGFTKPVFSHGFADYHASRDLEYAATIGRGALAGSLMIVAASLLGRFKDDADVGASEWAKPSTLGGYSIEQAVAAAANGFRHQDEWMKARHAGALTGQQQKSMSILCSALSLGGISELFADTSPAERLSMLIGGGSFDLFEKSILQYANGIAIALSA